MVICMAVVFFFSYVKDKIITSEARSVEVKKSQMS